MAPRPAHGFHVDVVEDRERVVVVVHGELDLVTAPVLGRHLEAVVQRGRRSVVVDLAGVTFLDVRGAHALVEADEAGSAAGSPLVLRGVRPRVRRTISLCGLEGALRFEPAG